MRWIGYTRYTEKKIKSRKNKPFPSLRVRVISIEAPPNSYRSRSNSNNQRTIINEAKMRWSHWTVETNRRLHLIRITHSANARRPASVGRKKRAAGNYENVIKSILLHIDDFRIGFYFICAMCVRKSSLLIFQYSANFVIHACHSWIAFNSFWATTMNKAETKKSVKINIPQKARIERHTISAAMASTSSPARERKCFFFWWIEN